MEPIVHVSPPFGDVTVIVGDEVVLVVFVLFWAWTRPTTNKIETKNMRLPVLYIIYYYQDTINIGNIGFDILAHFLIF